MNANIGARVRRAREQRGLSVGDAARLTKLSPRVLLAIEQNDFASLPAGLYRKAYLRTVAAEVGLDPLETAAEYETQYEAPFASAVSTGDAAGGERWIDTLWRLLHRITASLKRLQPVMSHRRWRSYAKRPRNSNEVQE